MAGKNNWNVPVDAETKRRLRHFKEGMGVTYAEALRYLLRCEQMVNESDFEHGLRIAQKNATGAVAAKE